MIGSAIARALRSTPGGVIDTTRRADVDSSARLGLDLASHPSSWNVPSTVDAAVVCAGATTIDACAADPTGTRLVNVERTAALGRMLTEQGAHVVYLSSNQVFGGDVPLPEPDAAISPVNEYGRQKAEAELRLREVCGRRLSILRLTKVLGSENPLFAQWSADLLGGRRISPFTNMVLAPVPLALVVSTVIDLMERRVPGTFHLSAENDVTYADAAKMAVRSVGASEDQIVQKTLAPVGSIAHPIRSALGMKSTTAMLGIRPADARATITAAFVDPVSLEYH